MPLNFAAKKKTVGGNAPENWALLQLLPLIAGTKIPVSEPVGQVLLNLKDIVELVLAPVHSRRRFVFLDSKIFEHQHRFCEAFPKQRLIPKHHFLEPYPQLCKAFGPLVSLWTMRFEEKHSFFKRAVRHTHSFRNFILSLSAKHQIMVAYDSRAFQPTLQVTKLSEVDWTVLREDIKTALETKIPGESSVQMAKTVCYNGVTYAIME